MAQHRKEFYEYKDTGCKVSPSCLDCPLLDCNYGEAPQKVKERHQTVITLYNKGKTVQELANSFSYSVKSIQRIVKHR